MIHGLALYQLVPRLLEVTVPSGYSTFTMILQLTLPAPASQLFPHRVPGYGLVDEPSSIWLFW